MRYARIKVEKSIYEAREKSVELETFHGTVFAPKSKIIVEGERKPCLASNTFVQILVPCWVFWNKDLNPCQLTTGYIEQINR